MAKIFLGIGLCKGLVLKQNLGVTSAGACPDEEGIETNVPLIPHMLGAGACPDEEGIETSSGLGLTVGIGAGACPDEEGIETRERVAFAEFVVPAHALMKKGLKPRTQRRCARGFVPAHALMKKGLKRKCLPKLLADRAGACPDEEGIETKTAVLRRMRPRAGACPDEEGIETLRACGCRRRDVPAHALMKKGLKQDRSRRSIDVVCRRMP